MSDQDLMWFGYLHISGRCIVKRWFGDVRDYTTDCWDNPFVKIVVPPFKAENRDKALSFILSEVSRKQIDL